MSLVGTTLKGTKELFEIADYDPNRDRYSVGNFTASDLSKTVYLPFQMLLRKRFN